MKAFLSVTTSLRVFMQVVCLFGLVFLPVVMVSFVYGEPLWFAYLVFSLTLISLSWFFAQSLAFSHDLTQRQGFALLVFIWFGLGFVS